MQWIESGSRMQIEWSNANNVFIELQSFAEINWNAWGANLTAKHNQVEFEI